MAKRKIDKNKDGTFKKGVVTNPKGRPKVPAVQLLRDALQAQGEKEQKDFFTLVAEKAFADTDVLKAVLKKFVPDRKAVEAVIADVDTSMTDEEAAAIRNEIMANLGILPVQAPERKPRKAAKKKQKKKKKKSK